MRAQRLRILGVVGSLRRASYNRGLMRAAIELGLPEVEIEVFDLGEFPPFNQDQELDPPDVVQRFKETIRASDALLIATPEYNYGVPGVLKNAIDWASRPYAENPFADKPVGLMGATIGLAGTVRSQLALRQTFVFLNAHPLSQPEVLVTFAEAKFDADGNLIDEETRGYVRDLLEALVAWTRRVGR